MTALPKDDIIRSSKVTQSARGQTCTARFRGICNGNPETSQFAHLNGADFGKAGMLKAHDVCGFYACSACHAYYDTGHGTHPVLTDAELRRCLLVAVCTTLVRLVRAKIVSVPLDTPKPFLARPTPPRKPPEERKAIPAAANPWPEGRKLQSKNTLRKERVQ